MKKETVLNIFWCILLIIGGGVAYKLSKNPDEILIIYIAYVTLLYAFIKCIQNNIDSNKPRKIFILEECDNDELLQYRLNTELKNLNKQGFTVDYVKIMPIKKFIKVLYKAYIIYY